MRLQLCFSQTDGLPELTIFISNIFVFVVSFSQGQSHDQGQPLTMMDSKTKADGQRVSQFEDKWDIVGRHADGDRL